MVADDSAGSPRQPDNTLARRASPRLYSLHYSFWFLFPPLLLAGRLLDACWIAHEPEEDDPAGLTGGWYVSAGLQAGGKKHGVITLMRDGIKQPWARFVESSATTFDDVKTD